MQNPIDVGNLGWILHCNCEGTEQLQNLFLGALIMMRKKLKSSSIKGWLYLLPALLFLGIFMVYPLVDVFVYSFEEGYNSASQTYFGVGSYNYSYVLHDPYFLQAVHLRV